MTHIPDITIVGGGIIGLLTARELAKAGAQVRILEKRTIGQESSWAGGGILLPIYPWRQPRAVSDLVRLSLDLYPSLIDELKMSTDIDPEWSRCGLFISQNHDIDAAIAWCNHYRIDYQTTPTPFLSHLRMHLINPLWLPNIAHARNPRLLKSARQDALNNGVELIEHCLLERIDIVGGKVVSITTQEKRYPVDQIVITAGAWTKTLFEHYLPDRTAPSIEPIKGQMLLYDAPPNTLPCMVLDKDQYLIPRLDGKILAGSSVERSGFDKSTTSEAFDRLKLFAETLCPALNTTPIIKHWAGLRPGTERGVPYICKHPEIDNLHINTGHFRNGLVMAPASARLMTDLILGAAPAIDPTPYDFSSAH
ncbi:MAG: glycine oxidase ThiO [Methylomicrobium sp.]